MDRISGLFFVSLLLGTAPVTLAAAPDTPPWEDDMRALVASCPAVKHLTWWYMPLADVFGVVERQQAPRCTPCQVCVTLAAESGGDVLDLCSRHCIECEDSVMAALGSQDDPHASFACLMNCGLCPDCGTGFLNNGCPCEPLGAESSVPECAIR